jgi:hypothetical protein
LPPCVVAREACGGAHHVGRCCLWLERSRSTPRRQ